MTRHDPASWEHHGDVPVVLPRITACPAGNDDAELVVVYRDDRTDTSDEVRVAPGVLGAVIAGCAERAGVPVRVEVHALDGAVYADIIGPPDRRPAAIAAEGSAEEASVPKTVAQGGFLPGETVLVARVVATRPADPDGRLVLGREDALHGAGDVLLVGSVSRLAVARSWP